ncbi:ribonuclease J [Paraglaciecola sp. 25GB23A]|uniref:ribonuclease J n=1 Tax=Paraglaciecola sp. 25GB23A TaxID=3156068 RepID=UPI0032AE8F36
MNMNLYGHAGSWLMVDCGVTFQSPLRPEYLQTEGSSVLARDIFDVVSADPSFISSRKQQLAGIVITHAHEDHVGALPYLWQRFKCPVYTTKYTAEILRRKLNRDNLAQRMPIIEVETNQRVDIGPFNVEWLGITHSIPEPHALMIRTEAGSVFHTADWKIDKKPITDQPFNAHPFKLLAKQNVNAMVCDSTNALRPGHSISESECSAGLLELVEQATGRVVVGCFSSNIARMISLAQIAQKTGRYLALFGRSLQNTVGAAKATGHWPDDLNVIDAYHAGYLLKHEVLAVATGSQGESRAALSQMAQDNYRNLSLEADDLIIFSSIIIPGNEKLIDRMIEQFHQRKIRTILAEEHSKPIHASGHPYQDELKLMYEWVKPQLAIPTHGEPKHLRANADIANQCHVPKSLTGLNGDLFIIAPQPKLIKSAVKTGRIALQQ